MDKWFGGHRTALTASSRLEATGRDRPDTELPTRLTPSPEIELAAPWRQTMPADFSQPDIRWYTWGFEGRSFFAARVERADPGGRVQVDAQACTDRLCAMVDALPVPVTRSSVRSVDPAHRFAPDNDKGAKVTRLQNGATDALGTLTRGPTKT